MGKSGNGDRVPSYRFASVVSHRTGSPFAKGAAYLLPFLRVRLWLHPRRRGGRAVRPRCLDVTAGLGRRTLSAVLGGHYREGAHTLIKKNGSSALYPFPHMSIVENRAVVSREWHVLALGVPLCVSAYLTMTIPDVDPTPIDLVPYAGLSYEPDRFLETGVTTGCVNMRLSLLGFHLNVSAQRTYLTREEQRQDRILRVTLPWLSPKRLLRVLH